MLLDPQIGAVGVRADDPEWDLRVPALLGVPRHQRASPTVKYRPGLSGQRSASRSSRYPAPSSRPATVAQT